MDAVLHDRIMRNQEQIKDYVLSNKPTFKVIGVDLYRDGGTVLIQTKTTRGEEYDDYFIDLSGRVCKGAIESLIPVEDVNEIAFLLHAVDSYKRGCLDNLNQAFRVMECLENKEPYYVRYKNSNDGK